MDCDEVPAPSTTTLRHYVHLREMVVFPSTRPVLFKPGPWCSKTLSHTHTRTHTHAQAYVRTYAHHVFHRLTDVGRDVVSKLLE